MFEEKIEEKHPIALENEADDETGLSSTAATDRAESSVVECVTFV